jgi:hypothetical protein
MAGKTAKFPIMDVTYKKGVHVSLFKMSVIHWLYFLSKLPLLDKGSPLPIQSMVCNGRETDVQIQKTVA